MGSSDANRIFRALKFKGELQANYKLLLYERTFKMPGSDVCVTAIELREFKSKQGDPKIGWKISFSNFSNSENDIIPDQLLSRK